MAIGLIVGGWFASVVISRLINSLIDYTKGKIDMWDELKDEMGRLEKALPKIQAVVSAVDQGLIREENPVLEKWLWRLRDAADMADDVMDEFEYNEAKEKAEAIKTTRNRLNTKKAASNFKSHLNSYVKRKQEAGKSFFQYAFNKDPVLKRLKEAVKAIDEVAADVGDFYMLVQNLERKQQKMDKYIVSDRETSSVLNVETQVFGRDNEREEIVNKLLNPGREPNGRNFSVLPIIGKGGDGKTTLAQLVYNHQRVKRYFDLRMWVCISNTFDVVMLTEKLYESAYGCKADFGNFDSIQRKLTEKLQFKKFLIVFDDAWNDNDRPSWQKLLAPLKSGNKRSMIVLTTRMEAVAKTIGANMDPIFLKGLNGDACWSLFSECAFGGENPICYPKLQKIGRCIVKKLKGSPLAAKTVGGVLCSRLNDEYWQSVLESEIWSLKHEHNGILPALRLSYQHLDSHLRPCFSFCSIFPQDQLFEKTFLINMWMAIGLVPHSDNGKKRPEDIGSEFFDELVKKSLLEIGGEISQLRDKFSPYYIMHDLLHDLAKFVSQGECFHYTNGSSASIPCTVRHLNADVGDPSEFNLSHLKNLRTLFLNFDINHPRLLDFINEVIKGLKSLRTLSISARYLLEFPYGVNDLVHLRYLFLYGQGKNILPQKKVNLYLLQVMSFYGAFQHLPRNFRYPVDNIENLINLREIRFSYKFQITLVGLGRLTSLQGMDFNVEDESGCRLGELKDMIELRTLDIRGLDYVGSYEEAIQANLSNKVNLRELSLSWEHPTDSMRKNVNLDEELLDHLKPHSQLKQLKICGHMGRGSPAWMRTLSDFQLERIHLMGCKWEYLPPLEELPYLNYLEIENMVAIKKFCVKSNWASQVGNFRSLKYLHLENMFELEEWFLGAQPSIWLPCLRELIIHNCPKLSSLPPLPSSLESLNLTDVGLVALPMIWQDRNNKCQSLPSLVKLSMKNCSKLKSLSDGLLHHPEHFTSLRVLKIINCKELMQLPQGGFSKFIALEKLIVKSCPKLQGHTVPKWFLPPSIQTLYIDSWDNLDKEFPKSLERVDSIVSLKIYDSAIMSLSLKQVIGRWKNLRELELGECKELASLEFLEHISLDKLSIYGCPKLIAAILLKPTLNKSEIETMKVEEISRQVDIARTGTHTDVRKWVLVGSDTALIFLRRLLSLFTIMFSFFRLILSKLNVGTLRRVPTSIGFEETLEIPSFSVDELEIDNTSLLCLEPLRNLSSVWKLTIRNCSELMGLEETMEIPSLSVDELVIDDPFTLFVGPIRNLSSVLKLTINDCSKVKTLPEPWLPKNWKSLQELRLYKLSSLESLPEELKTLTNIRVLTLWDASKLKSLPELPPLLEVLDLSACNKELKRKCSEGGEYWPKLAHIRLSGTIG